MDASDMDAGDAVPPRKGKRKRAPRNVAAAEPLRSRSGYRTPQHRGRAPRPGTGHKRTVLGAVREVPNFIRLLYGLITDPRVELTDKLLVAGAVAYVLIPEDIFPDFIPLVGEVDDVFVLVLALRRLMKSAGDEIVLEHWAGDPDDLDDLNLEKVLAAAAFFLPRRMRRRLRTIGRM
jgi:uncharacterized membrane protein YkvA (DUF1232 family)